MKVVKLIGEDYIHNYVELDTTEMGVMLLVSKIVDRIAYDNIHSCGADDEHLTKICREVSKGLAELTQYENEYTERED